MHSNASRQDLAIPKAWQRGIDTSVLDVFELPTIGKTMDWMVNLLKNVQVDFLFEPDYTILPNLREAVGGKPIETVAMESKAVHKSIDNSLSKSNNGLKRSRAALDEEAAEMVDAWFESFHRSGSSGNIGLVPKSLQDAYPVNAPLKLDDHVRAHVIHFYEWYKRHRRDHSVE